MSTLVVMFEFYFFSHKALQENKMLPEANNAQREDVPATIASTDIFMT